MALNSTPALSSKTDIAEQNENSDVNFYDSQGKAVAYIAEDSKLTIYLWSGKPVAYVDGNSVFGFNGKHLGWAKKRSNIRSGNIVAALAERFKTPVSPAPPKSFKQFEPFRAFEEFKPFAPSFGIRWSETPCKDILAGLMRLRRTTWNENRV